MEHSLVRSSGSPLCYNFVCFCNLCINGNMNVRKCLPEFCVKLLDAFDPVYLFSGGG